MKKNICIITAILAALCMSISVQAETEIIRITDNGYEDILPAIHGNTIVWQGRYNGEREIFLYDIATAQTHQITDNDYPDIAPQTDGRYVVWLGMNNSGGNIFYYDTNSGQTIQVTTDNEIITLKSPPRIANGRIVWAAQVLANSVLPGDIELYEIPETPGTGTIETISDPEDNLDDHTPLIDSTKVVWVQTGSDNIESTVFVYDLTSPEDETFPVPDNSATVQSPTQDGNLSVTTKFDGQDREIFLRHQRLRKNMQITDNYVEEKQAKIHGNHLVWVNGLGAEQEIYLGIVRLLSAITPGDGFVLTMNGSSVFEWEAIGFDRFRVEFSSTKDFTEGETFTFPSLSEPDPWLYETTSLTVDNNDMGEISGSFYWRIVAQDQYGNETTSQPRRIVVITDSDGDGVPDSDDNCVNIANPTQLDTDGDLSGDACDADDDNDTVLDTVDNCPLVANLDQANNDGDGQGDVCDADDDNDTVPDEFDLCPLINSSGRDVDNNGCIDSNSDIAQNIENGLVPELINLRDEIYTDPNIPETAAAEVQNAIDNLIGNNDGSANNGADDKIIKDALIAAIEKLKAAVSDLITADEVEGVDTTTIQAQITNHAKVIVQLAIDQAEVDWGLDDSRVLAAKQPFNDGNAMAESGDYMNALDLYKNAIQAL